MWISHIFGNVESLLICECAFLINLGMGIHYEFGNTEFIMNWGIVITYEFRSCDSLCICEWGFLKNLGMGIHYEFGNVNSLWIGEC